MMNKLLKFLRAEDGPTAVEYAVMLFLIVLVCIGAIGSVGLEASSSFSHSSDEISTRFAAAGVAQ